MESVFSDVFTKSIHELVLRAFMRPRTIWSGVVLGVLCFAMSSYSIAQVGVGGSDNVCGSLRNHYGPYDYRKDKDKLGVVEQYHFAPEVELLIKPQSSKYPSGDISYTLYAFPNHHRALIAMMKWGERYKSAHPPGTSRSIDCWFDRAVRFAPNDTIVRVIFAGHLGRTHRSELAKEHLAIATKHAGDNGFSAFNIGIAYFDLGDYPAALKQAHTAQQLGFTRPELQKLLEERNEWKPFQPEPPKPEKPTGSNGATPTNADSTDTESKAEKK